MEEQLPDRTLSVSLLDRRAPVSVFLSTDHQESAWSSRHRADPDADWDCAGLTRESLVCQQHHQPPIPPFGFLEPEPGFRACSLPDGSGVFHWGF